MSDRPDEAATVASGITQAAAYALALGAHFGQVDKVGKPYIDHPCRVAQAVAEATWNDDEVVQIAYLHDTVEDTFVTLDLLREFGFSERVVDGVDAMTKRLGESFGSYYERVKANPDALIVKWHDVADNANPDRLAKVAPDTQERLRAKYERARVALQPKDQP